MSKVRNFAPALAGVLLLAFAPYLHAQITDEILAHIDHSFVVGNTTLPPGDYTFQMMHNTDQSLMTVTSSSEKMSVTFLVREAMDDHAPAHADVFFRKYGNTEFLSKIFQPGSKVGARVTETSREEQHFVSQGEHGMEHSEEQK
jgi:hypothetical protein